MTERTEGDVAISYVTSLLDALVDGGVSHMCMTPGSRSTPIALAAARHPGITLHVHVDERSSAFFGLGIAAATGRPVAMFCTSGTAAANHLPAVVEASLSRVPIIVMTADRPPELHGVGANQTIDQQHLFGGFVKWFCDTGVPVSAAHERHRWWSMGHEAMQHAVRFPPPGPVHLNLPFREPLMPSGVQLDTAQVAYTESTTSASTPDRMPAFLREVSTGHRVVVVAGRVRVPPDVLIEACADRGWPLLAEPLSGLRGGSLSGGALLAANAGFRERYHPDLVIQFGAAPTSRGMQELVRSADRLLIVDPDHLVADPDRRATMTINNDPAEVAVALRAGGSSLPATRPQWVDEWHDADRKVRHAVDTLLDSWDEPFEGRVARDLAAAIPNGGVLFAGSSMPIRDLDMYMQSRDGLRVMANRGASGIDGLVSTAFGIATVSGPTYALLGDLSLLHDASGLLWGVKRCRNAVIVVIDNDGGGIFSMLPQASLPHDEFELLFGTPHGLDLEALARAAGAGVRTVDNARVLVPAVHEAAATGGVQVVRVRVVRGHAVEMRRSVSHAVSAALAD
jgi:2-succinyl-5-enolpyruvyl-6-hydroxy-3-cyclohexene-1-carboxylate synthase